ncbi:hypothetical protein DQM68_15310 [Leptospira mayottensis]|uniref:Uncharacterized protein n=2 Tax=Leptospira mayottensis TaxID=1137606 RepID=A0AA87MSB8_9LEPT|nr:hypothetical protein [Leptospira mayottensis]AZQ01710.1 hypothetical protein LEP1GSC190_06410 [Leptospira mayottensis 200901116]AXR61839.1 hypothetical protein DQM68_15310 [Leptospira mayottensis]AXR65753.1 hypothetical protein DQM28_17630 [Leptospira mayottensis]AXR69423.1 hypothetical protein DPV73_16730 [Leptospira mayottensis]EKS01854.1 hypothetical protein LEP1GSC125_3903 [Leptospira mayottensis 200901122]
MNSYFPLFIFDSKKIRNPKDYPILNYESDTVRDDLSERLKSPPHKYRNGRQGKILSCGKPVRAAKILIYQLFYIDFTLA